MFKITLSKPLHISGNRLTNELLTMLTPAGAVVEYMPDDDEVNSEGAAESPYIVEFPEIPDMEKEAPATAPKRRGRPPKVVAEEVKTEEEMEAEAKAAARIKAVSEALEEAKTGGEAGAADTLPDRAKLLEAFTSLVDMDYDKALNVLETFKVNRFSELKDEQLAAFAQAIR